MVKRATKKERIVPMQLAPGGEDAPRVLVRYVGPRRKREIRDLHTKEDPTSGLPFPVTDTDAVSSAMAREMVVGWENLTPEFIGAKLVFEDYDELPVDDQGNVPFSEDTLQDLWWNSERFATAVRAHASRIMEAEIAAKKHGGDSSDESSTASD